MIDIEDLKLKAVNHLCETGRESSKENRIIYKLGQALEQLQAENKELREAQKWISVDDRLPEKNGEYLVYYYNQASKEKWIGVENYIIKKPEWKIFHTFVTHWQPLPKTPKEDV